uniref:Ion transport domain-containing protein n=1 Tax=Papio anubis TaxID=9555 RepID=A0A8I5R209_PAPAN
MNSYFSILYYRRQHYFSDLLNILDTAITVIILLVDVIYIFFDVKFLKDVPRWTRLFRLLRLIILIRVFHLAHLQRQLGKLIRRLVSGNKRRYKRDGFEFRSRLLYYWFVTLNC